MSVKLEVLLTVKMSSFMLKLIACLATITSLVSWSTSSLAGSPASVKAQTVAKSLVGQWQVRLSTGQPLTVTVTPEGTLYIADPFSNEAIEVGRQIKQISDIGTLPPRTQILGSFENQAKIAKQSEAKQFVGAINRAQQAFYIYYDRFSADVPSLGVGTEIASESYQYSTRVGGGAVQNIGQAKVEGLKSYTGIVAVRKIDNENLTIAVLCESNQPTTALPPKPSQSDIKYASCPDGYSVLAGYSVLDR